MFETLTDRFDDIFTRLRGRGRISEADLDQALREIRLALLDGDVHLDVVRELVNKIRARAAGADLAKSLTPAQQVLKIVGEELTAILGGEPLRISYASMPPTVVLLAGLQGSGKTSAAAKLACWFRAQGRHPLLVAADLQRPAAVEQLRVLGRQVGAAVFSAPTDPVDVARRGVAEAIRVGRDVAIIDTAGRVSVDAALMEEVRSVARATSPRYTFLVLDAMTGQDAVATAVAFHEALNLDGAILTKLDGDARGGAALSFAKVVGRPIAFVSTGERVDDFETFRPERIAGRILGMGDVLSLIERAEQTEDGDGAGRVKDRMRSGRFSLEDFYDQLQRMKRLGPLSGIVGMLPGLPKEMRNAPVDESNVTRIEAIIESMTPAERDDPAIINGSRRSRIAAGSGTKPAEVNDLLNRFREMQKLMRSSGMMAGARPGGRRDKRKGGRVTPARSR
ncbi:MAG TPA: signal recognition particle protein [Acidimicrobiales bacterium]|nr:signal recognition particle protein [Acidimicrobiales bacterium]